MYGADMGTVNLTIEVSFTRYVLVLNMCTPVEFITVFLCDVHK